MYHNYLNVNDALPELAGYVLKGDEVGTRTGNRVMERLHETVALLEPWMRYSLLPQRRASLPAQIAETMWVLAGRNDVEWLSHYLPRAPEFSDDGEVWRGGYGPRLRHFDGIDQVKHVVDLLKKDPLTRRAVISIYDPNIDSQPGKDIPCNDFISFQSRLGALNMHVFVRSNDLMWGWSGINTFEWSVLQEVIASILGIGVGHLTFSISSLHVYDRHWKRMRELHEAYPDVSKTPWGVDFDAPRMGGDVRSVQELDDDIALWMRSEKKIRQAASFEDAWEHVKATEVNPMFKGWLEVITCWWWDAGQALIKSRTLRSSLALSPKPERPLTKKPGQSYPGLVDILPKDLLVEVKKWETKPTETPKRSWDDFVDGVVEMHRVKHESYGNSWKKRGETLGILANIARKVDRLGSTDQYETAMDTAVDLLVYLVKYQLFLLDQSTGSSYSDGHEQVGAVLRARLLQNSPESGSIDAATLRGMIDRHLLVDPEWVHRTPVDKLRTVIVDQDSVVSYIIDLWMEKNK